MNSKNTIGFLRSKRSMGLAVIAALILSGSNLPGQASRASDAVVAIRNVNVVPMDTERIEADQTVILRGAAIEHLDGYLELVKGFKPVAREKLLEVVRRTLDAGIWNCPTMAVMEANLGLIDEARLLSRPELEYVPEAFVNLWLKFRSYGNPPRTVSEAMHENRKTLLKALNDGNARILLGTDSPQLFNVPGFSIQREIRLMADAGLKPYDILRSATARVGEYTGRPCGTIKAGQCANLILLDANPLKDLQNLNLLAGVVVQGRWLPSSELQRRLKAIRERPGNYRRQASSGQSRPD